MSDPAQAASAAAAPAPSPSPAPAAFSSSTGSFQLTPLYGCDSAGAALCSVLRLDECTLLLDLGWDERYSEEQLTALKRIIPEVDAVLITHPDLAHLGALPYAVGVLGLTAPVYCTLPVWRNGQMFMYDAYQALAVYDTPPFTLDDVDKAFDSMRQLKYSETVRLRERGDGIEITPSCAGHMLGGAFWHIKKDVESIIYAVDFNHAAERHLNGALLNAPQLHRPSALITDATNVLVTSAKRSLQDQTLISTVSDRLRSGGSVLMPVDAAGRVLELLLVLHGAWAQHQLHASYTLAFLSSQSGNTVDFARSQLEWMTDKCRKMFDTHKINPFALAHLRLITTREDVDALVRGGRPFCLLASNATLETGLAQDALCAMSGDPRNLLLFTQRAPAWSVAGQFFDHSAPNAVRRNMPREIQLMKRRRVKLEGEELDKFQEERKIKREQSALESQKDAMAEDADEDEDMDIGKTEAAKKKVQQKFPMFPFAEPKRTFDIWGETLTADELRAITGATAMAAPSSAALAFAKQEEEARAKRLADEEAMRDAEPEEEPQKTIKEVVTYIDFEGRSDGRSMKTVIKDVQPRKLILIGGTAAAKSHLKSHCLTNEICGDVVIPSSNQTISVTSESNIYRVNLKESLFHQLQFVQVSDEYEVAYVEGEVNLNYQQSNLPILQSADDPHGHAAVFLGQVRPNELQQILQNDGIACDLVGGVLVCSDGRVNVHKVSEFQISIQGALCDDYFRIRDLLYQQYQIV